MESRVFLERMAAAMLGKLNKCLDAKQYHICGRDKNRDFLASNGFTLEDQLTILRSLTPADCIKAEEDRDDPNHMDTYWFHKKNYDGLLVYVKYKIVILEPPEGDGDFAFIKSIHEDGF